MYAIAEEPTELAQQVYRFVFIARGHHYVFDCTPESRDEMLRRVGLLAAEPELDFTWHDAAQVTSIIRASVPAASNPVQTVDPRQVLRMDLCDLALWGIVFVAFAASLFVLFWS